MKTKTLRPKRFRTILLLLVCILFVCTGFMMRKEDPVMAWFSIVFFGLGIIVFIIQLWPSSSYLKLTEEGFEVRSLYKSSFTKWTDVNTFTAGLVGLNKMVFFDYQDNHTEYKKGKEIAKSLVGSEAALPNTYGMSAKRLAELMNEWKTKHTS